MLWWDMHGLSSFLDGALLPLWNYTVTLNASPVEPLYTVEQYYSQVKEKVHQVSFLNVWVEVISL